MYTIVYNYYNRYNDYITMEEFYTINQAAIVLKVHPLTIRRYIKEGRLKAYRVGGNIRISLNDIRSFTQNFIPQTKTVKRQDYQTVSGAKPFSFDDPLLSLKARGISMGKLEQQ